MASINQTLIIRTDIFNLPEDSGLLAAQVAHIHFEITRDMIDQGMDDDGKSVLIFNEQGEQGADFEEWVKEPYLLVKKVPNLEALDHFHKLAKEAGLPTNEWKDTVYVRLSPTMKQAFPNVLVGISIGPADADKIRTVVGDLPLL